MQISFRAQGTGGYTVLGDDAAGGLITGFLPRMTGIPQVTPLFRATTPLIAARGNRSWELKGSIDTDNGTEDASVDFIRSQALAIPDFVDIKIVDGGTTWYLTPAVFIGFEPIVQGRSSRIAYTFVGGKVTSVAP